MTQLLLSFALFSSAPLCSTFSPLSFFSRLKVSLSQSLPRALTRSLCACVIRLFPLCAPTISHLFTLISISSISTFPPSQSRISVLFSALLLFHSACRVRALSPALSVPHSASHFTPSHLSISPPPAVAEDDKPPYTILCAQAVVDKSCSVEGVGVGAGWGPQRNGFNLNYSS